MWFTGKEYEKREFVIYSEHKKEEVARMEYKEKIIELVEKINNEKFIKFLYEMLLSFQKKWGI